jgi:hypothetical protein
MIRPTGGPPEGVYKSRSDHHTCSGPVRQDSCIYHPINSFYSSSKRISLINVIPNVIFCVLHNKHVATGFNLRRTSKH